MCWWPGVWNGKIYDTIAKLGMLSDKSSFLHNELL